MDRIPFLRFVNYCQLYRHFEENAAAEQTHSESRLTSGGTTSGTTRRVHNSTTNFPRAVSNSTINAHNVFSQISDI